MKLTIKQIKQLIKEERFKALSNYLKLNSKFVTGKDLKLQNQDSIEKIGQSIQNVIKKRQDGRKTVMTKFIFI